MWKADCRYSSAEPVGTCPRNERTAKKKKTQGKTKQRTIQRRDSCPRASLACTSCRVCHSNPAASSLGENRGHSVEGRGEVLPTCRLKGPVCKAATDFDRCQQIIGSRAGHDHGAAVSSGSLPSLKSLPLKKKKKKTPQNT